MRIKEQFLWAALLVASGMVTNLCQAHSQYYSLTTPSEKCNDAKDDYAALESMCTYAINKDLTTVGILEICSDLSRHEDTVNAYCGTRI